MSLNSDLAKLATAALRNKNGGTDRASTSSDSSESFYKPDLSELLAEEAKENQRAESFVDVSAAAGGEAGDGQATEGGATGGATSPGVSSGDARPSLVEPSKEKAETQRSPSAPGTGRTRTAAESNSETTPLSETQNGAEPSATADSEAPPPMVAPEIDLESPELDDLDYESTSKLAHSIAIQSPWYLLYAVGVLLATYILRFALRWLFIVLRFAFRYVGIVLEYVLLFIVVLVKWLSIVSIVAIVFGGSALYAYGRIARDRTTREAFVARFNALLPRPRLLFLGPVAFLPVAFFVCSLLTFSILAFFSVVFLILLRIDIPRLEHVLARRRNFPLYDVLSWARLSLYVLGLSSTDPIPKSKAN